ncbi:MAG: lipoprotein insertase outer membrane protein LolB [Betaproteobacteria bacterium]
MRVWASIWLLVLLTACATPTPSRSVAQAPSDKQWQGRLSVTVQSDPPRNMSAGFSLDGDARQGELNLFSPLGTTLATLQWNPATTQWLQGSQQRRYDSMAHLTEETTGAALPMDAMFDWLQGKATASPGWQADLSALNQGTLIARRLSPEPLVVLRIKLDTP